MVPYAQYCCAPGKGPFRVRGNAYRGHLEYTEKHIRGGVPAMLEVFGNPELKAFFDQRFFAASWYDLFPLIAAGDACAELTKQSSDAFFRMRTGWQAEKDLGGIYQVMLQIVSERWLAQRIPRALSDYFNFVVCNTEAQSSHHVTAVYHQVPDLVTRWMAPVTEAYTIVGIEKAGGTHVNVRTSRTSIEAKLHGYPCSELRSEIRWR